MEDVVIEKNIEEKEIEEGSDDWGDGGE